jgi:5-methylcytosine-specific restriction endonuclease McrA
VRRRSPETDAPWQTTPTARDDGGARARQLAREPLCRACQVDGQVTAAREVDHVVRIEEGGEAWGPANLQSLCKAHHSLKTAQYDLKGKDWRQWETRGLYS